MVNESANSGKEAVTCLEQVFTNVSYPHHKLFSVFRTLCILVCRTVSNSDPHQGIIPPSFTLWLSFDKHLCSPHRWRFQWSWWLWQCSLHRHLNWICKQSIDSGKQIWTGLHQHLIYHSLNIFWSLRTSKQCHPSPSLSLPFSPFLSLSLSEAKLTYRYLLHLSIFMASPTPTLIKESYLQAFHYDSTSTSTCAALIGGGSSAAGGSDSVACIGTSTESASSQLTVANRSEQVFTNISYIILSTYFDHFEAMQPLSFSLSLSPLPLPFSLSLSLSQAKLTYRYLLHLSIFMASPTPTLIKESYLQAFHYDSTSTSTCAALIGGGSSEAGGSDSVACIGTSTESASRVNWQWQTDLNKSSPTSHISFSQHILITSNFEAMPPISLSLSRSLSLWSQADLPLFVAFVHIHGVSNSNPHQGIIPPSFSLWLNFDKHLCSPHRWRFQWSWWLWQCSLHRHLNWICKQSQLTVANRSEQVFTNISYIILSTYFDHFELRSNVTPSPSLSL